MTNFLSIVSDLLIVIKPESGVTALRFVLMMLPVDFLVISFCRSPCSRPSLLICLIFSYVSSSLVVLVLLLTKGKYGNVYLP